MGAQLGLIKGSSNGMFLPRDNATIAEASTFILRLILLADTVENNDGNTDSNGNTGNSNNNGNSGNDNNSGNNNNENAAFIVKEITNGNLVDKQSYTSFEAAEKAVTNGSLVVTQNNKIIKNVFGYDCHK
ncbi:hypothetical protein OL548_09545 [Lysinibacillus sp. MHQ-1]|nr:hypothetical protein OL548_09545 [Lysinibacillus sp. MHQ-1]